MSPLSTPQTPPSANRLKELIETFFSNPEKRLTLKKEDYLFKRNQYNDRLYLVLSGVLIGQLQGPDGALIETFKARKHQFVGVNSFFSETYQSFTDVIAEEDTAVAYIDQEEVQKANSQGVSLSERFMPIIIHELLSRQQRIQKIAGEKEQALKTLIQKEKMASLGQISAGIAHELNNAIAVLLRNTEWLSQCLIDVVHGHEPDALPLFKQGLHQGRSVSSREARKRSKELQKKYNLSLDLADTLASSGLNDSQIAELIRNAQLTPDNAAHAWELGATLSDMRIAADHADHVVKSIKALGAQKSERESGLDLNCCLREAQTLLASPLRKVNVVEEFGEIPTITGNHGEWVQVCINLMNNACEALSAAKTAEPEIRLRTYCENHWVVLQVEDNGPGIPEEIRDNMFEPSITTKTDGTTVGLGLGLTIVHRLVESYDGKINVESRPGRTVFTIRIPGGES